MYAKVENGQVTKVGLPTTGILADERTVSNYYLLPDDVLKAEGWLPCEEVKPDYNKATQRLVIDTKTILSGKVIITYKAIDMPK